MCGIPIGIFNQPDLPPRKARFLRFATKPCQRRFLSLSHQSVVQPRTDILRLREETRQSYGMSCHFAAALSYLNQPELPARKTRISTTCNKLSSGFLCVVSIGLVLIRPPVNRQRRYTVASLANPIFRLGISGSATCNKKAFSLCP